MAYQDGRVKGLRANPVLRLRGHLARRINGMVLGYGRLRVGCGHSVAVNRQEAGVVSAAGNGLPPDVQPAAATPLAGKIGSRTRPPWPAGLQMARSHAHQLNQIDIMTT